MRRRVGDSTGKMSRYVVISAATGTMDFGIAFVLLNLGFPPTASLAISIVLAGVCQYFALEWWGFRRHGAAFSLRRLAGSGAVELTTYLVRIAVRVVALKVWRSYFPAAVALDHFLGLAVAYAVGFVVGYFLRSRVVFRAGEE